MTMTLLAYKKNKPSQRRVSYLAWLDAREREQQQESSVALSPVTPPMSQWFLSKGVTEWSPFRSPGATTSGAVENTTSEDAVAPAGDDPAPLAGASSSTVENPALASGVATAAPVDGAADAARSLLDIDMGGNVEVGEKPEVQADPEVPDDQAAPMDDQELKEEDAAPMDDQEPEEEDDDQGSGDKDKK